ncbi:hypothetical protein FX988_04314 (plasmid) [Paraglaciecola mesophila]|jgi:hypothetical protein|uniref:Uncharacterized protein n=1 Tax=Paraglaciecola mesophila TaxID=197222 RepID=A0A857JRF6_9ALTE|nr:hypothetical protein FX988_04314 [Paraglaciecola mesophila]
MLEKVKIDWFFDTHGEVFASIVGSRNPRDFRSNEFVLHILVTCVLVYLPLKV